MSMLRSWRSTKIVRMFLIRLASSGLPETIPFILERKARERERENV